MDFFCLDCTHCAHMQDSKLHWAAAFVQTTSNSRKEADVNKNRWMTEKQIIGEENLDPEGSAKDAKVLQILLNDLPSKKHTNKQLADMGIMLYCYTKNQEVASSSKETKQIVSESLQGTGSKAKPKRGAKAVAGVAVGEQLQVSWVVAIKQLRPGFFCLCFFSNSVVFVVLCRSSMSSLVEKAEKYLAGIKAELRKHLTLPEADMNQCKATVGHVEATVKDSIDLLSSNLPDTEATHTDLKKNYDGLVEICNLGQQTIQDLLSKNGISIKKPVQFVKGKGKGKGKSTEVKEEPNHDEKEDPKEGQNAKTESATKS